MKRFEKLGDVTIKIFTFPIRVIVGVVNAVEKNMPETLTMPYEIKKKEEKNGTDTNEVQF
jgi:hypothetical protein|tara:strand:- start:288 stop:467 length:180 start_codon:yes stop_codon:yes gene_type:complete